MKIGKTASADKSTSAASSIRRFVCEEGSDPTEKAVIRKIRITAPFGTIMTSNLGKMLDKGKNRGTPRQYLRNVNVRWFAFDVSDLQKMRVSDDEQERYSIRKGDLVVCEGGEPGRCAIWSEEAPICFQKALHRIRFPGASEPKFYMYYLWMLAQSGTLAKFFTGTGIKHLTGESLKKIPVPVPSLSEQKRIVAKIEELFSELDNGVETLQKTKQQLAVYRQAVLKAAFDFSEGKAIPACDVVTRARHSLAIGPFGSDLKVSDYTSAGIPLVFVRDIRNGFAAASGKYISPAKAKQLSAHQVKHGDLLVTKMGDPPGDCCIYPFDYPAVITADCIKLEIAHSKILSSYAMYFIQSIYGKEQIKRMTQGVAQKKISLGRFKRFLFRIPKLAKQRTIVASIESRLSVCTSIEKTVDAALQQAEAMRQSILKKAFEGGL